MEISGRTFLIDLICLPLSQMDVILGMDWLSSNHVLLNCFDKTVVFDDSKVSKDRMFISTNQVVTSLKEDAQVYMILSMSETVTVRLWFKLLSLISVLCLTSSNCTGYILFFSLNNCMLCERQVMMAFCFILLSCNQ